MVALKKKNQNFFLLQVKSKCLHSNLNQYFSGVEIV